jgi:hypothetical protein
MRRVSEPTISRQGLSREVDQMLTKLVELCRATNEDDSLKATDVDDVLRDADIGVNVQAWAAFLDAWAAINPASAFSPYALIATLAGTGASQGASTIGVRDVGALLTATTVEAALAEIVAKANKGLQRYLVFEMDGGGDVLTVGDRADLRVPFACTITKWTLLGRGATASSTGSIVVDVWKDTFAAAPPTGGDTITGGDEPTISATTKAESSSLGSWNTTINAGDTLRINIDSVSSFLRATLVLEVTMT